MPHGSRAAITFAAVAAAVAASIPARGQTVDRFGPPLRSDTPLSPSVGLVRPDRPPPPRPPQSQRDLLPPPVSWSSTPWSASQGPRAGASHYVATEQQAMDLLAAAGFANVYRMQPNVDGSWTGYASREGRTVRATVDMQGNISAK